MYKKGSKALSRLSSSVGDKKPQKYKDFSRGCACFSKGGQIVVRDLTSAAWYWKESLTVQGEGDAEK